MYAGRGGGGIVRVRDGCVCALVCVCVHACPWQVSFAGSCMGGPAAFTSRLKPHFRNAGMFVYICFAGY